MIKYQEQIMLSSLLSNQYGRTALNYATVLVNQMFNVIQKFQAKTLELYLRVCVG